MSPGPLPRCAARGTGLRQPHPRNRSLFGGADRTRDDLPPPLPPEDQREKLRREFAILGLLCDRHPMELYAPVLQKLNTVKAVDLPRHIGRQVRLAGWLITGKEVTTKHGDPM